MCLIVDIGQIVGQFGNSDSRCQHCVRTIAKLQETAIEKRESPPDVGSKS